MHNISQSSQARGGDTAAVQQLDGASPACVPERSRLGGPKEKTQDNADTALIRLFTSNKDGGTCRAVARAARASEKGSSSCSRRDRVLSNLPNHSSSRVPPARWLALHNHIGGARGEHQCSFGGLSWGGARHASRGAERSSSCGASAAAKGWFTTTLSRVVLWWG